MGKETCMRASLERVELVFILGLALGEAGIRESGRLKTHFPYLHFTLFFCNLNHLTPLYAFV